MKTNSNEERLCSLLKQGYCIESVQDDRFLMENYTTGDSLYLPLPSTVEESVARGYRADRVEDLPDNKTRVHMKRGNSEVEYIISARQADKIFRPWRLTPAPSISIRDFEFSFAGYGHYLVTYTSPATGKKWTRTIEAASDLIETTLNNECPKVKDLKRLKAYVKYNY